MLSNIIEMNTVIMMNGSPINHNLSENNFKKDLGCVIKNTRRSSAAAYLVNHFHPLGQVIKRLQLCDVIN